MNDFDKLDINTAGFRAADFAWRLDVLSKLKQTFELIELERESFFAAQNADAKEIHFSAWATYVKDLEGFLIKADINYIGHA